ncbi:hypothetical protein FLM48_13315 [Shewanella sp. Scap07]|uniref:hypothetical protein n=1 Tax=Shewanella sp. Scap07 TaxID=2589987 RepID=UPI0015BE413E|nr:hypothetical protein [Shewanella sp. Scap07]QLE85964.1 hypothetical protein FLM48_13315 [Shewanella sp. Scap07]
MLPKTLKHVVYLCLLLPCLTIGQSAPALAKPTHMGLHGMLMFGGQQGLIASHLPMYHVPHNAQVLFQFHFVDAKVDKAIKQALQPNPNQVTPIWTIVPQPFDLMTLSTEASATSVRLIVDIVEGHFERGGVTKYQQQALVIDKLLLFALLDMGQATQTPKQATYCLLNLNHSTQEQYLYKRLAQRPETDHLLRISSASPLPAQCHSVDVTPANTATMDTLSEQFLADDLSGEISVIYAESDELQ